jgi:hypothetical protein
MKYLAILMILFSIIGFQVDAQTYFEKYGKISPAEAEMKSCSYDASADAVVLFDVGKSSFERTENGYDILYQRISRIKILNEAGKRYAEISIPYYQEGGIYEQIKGLKATTYSISDGHVIKITQLDPAASYEEKINENWKAKKFALPDVQPGCIIEYTYNLYSQYHFNLRDWEFQGKIPVLYSGYEVKMIPFYEYNWVLQGRTSIDEFTNYEETGVLKQEYYGSSFYNMVYKFGLKNVPALLDEEYSPTREDNIIKIDFQLSGVFQLDGTKIKIMTTWPELVKEYMKRNEFGKYIKKSAGNALKIMDPDSLDGKTELQKFNYVVDYVKDNFKWNDENDKMANKSPSDLQKDKIGNSAALNLWLVGALQAVGIEAYPVALSTRDHGKILSDYPFSSSFNSVIAYALIDGNPMLADATDPYCPNNKISMQCISEKGLLIDNDKMKWLSLQSNAGSSLVTSIKIDSIGIEQQAEIVCVATNYEALYYRNRYAGRKNVLREALSKKYYQIEDTSFKVRYESDRTKPYACVYTTRYKSEIINDKIYVQPFLNESFTENPLKQKTRTYPVDLVYPVKRTYKSEIVIPQGYKVEFLPANSTLNDELFGLEYSTTQSESTITITLMYEFKHSVYPPEEYNRVKALFDRIVKKSTEKIVLVKK